MIIIIIFIVGTNANCYVETKNKAYLILIVNNTIKIN